MSIWLLSAARYQAVVLLASSRPSTMTSSPPLKGLMSLALAGDEPALVNWLARVFGRRHDQEARPQVHDHALRVFWTRILARPTSRLATEMAVPVPVRLAWVAESATPSARAALAVRMP